MSFPLSGPMDFVVNVEKTSDTAVLVAQASKIANVNVEYRDSVGERIDHLLDDDDLDFAKQMEDYDTKHGPLQSIEQTHGSLWARKGENLHRFWDELNKLSK